MKRMPKIILAALAVFLVVYTAYKVGYFSGLVDGYNQAQETSNGK